METQTQIFMMYNKLVKKSSTTCFRKKVIVNTIWPPFDEMRNDGNYE